MNADEKHFSYQQLVKAYYIVLCIGLKKLTWKQI